MKQQTVNRLKRIEGQVRGVTRMVEEDRYCIDVLVQLQAARAALARVEERILEDHAATCIDEAIRGGNVAEQRQKVAELVALFGKARP